MRDGRRFAEREYSEDLAGDQNRDRRRGDIKRQRLQPRLNQSRDQQLQRRNDEEMQRNRKPDGVARQ